MQMDNLGKGYEHRIDIQIKKGDEQGIDLRPYAEKGCDNRVLKQIRYAKLAGIDLDDYLEEGFDGEQLHEIWVAIEEGIDLLPYLRKGFCGAQLRQIRKGLRHLIDVDVYADIVYNWLQMKEIRLGLQNRVDVSVYAKPLFSHAQMCEIRLGMEDGIDVESYARLLYGHRDMQDMRRELTKDLYGAKEKLKEIEMVDEGSGMSILLSADRLEAYMIFPQEQRKVHISVDYVEQVLRRNGVVYGIDRERISRALEEKCFGEKVLVACGDKPLEGEDGTYKFFFNTEPSRKPVELEDGRVDYQNVDIFEEVEQGQTLARYIAPKPGREGRCVRGMPLPGIKGKEQPVLQGKGFYLDEDGITYIAGVSGVIEYIDDSIQIYESLIIKEDVSTSYGNVKFHGCVHIIGNVGANVEIEAQGSVVVDGTVEAAEIVSGGDVLIKNGMVGAGKGQIQAKGNISGNFFEACMLRAGANIEAGYLMNSESEAEKRVIMMGKRGSIIGGRTRALYVVEAQRIGNRAKLETQIEVGTNEEVLKHIQKCQEECEQAKSNLIKLERHIDKMNPEEEESALYRQVLSAYLKQKEILEEATQRRQKAMEILKENPTVTVSSTAYAGTRIIINQVQKRLEQDYKMAAFYIEENEIVEK